MESTHINYTILILVPAGSITIFVSFKADQEEVVFPKTNDRIYILLMMKPAKKHNVTS